ncbi:hypothetical protein Pint_05168 [Pistacia integerrima]|uniref:Uncharacterized protein n=1 Tax=Pistacia integerrima TaxID=434235 RepID=A0ACC0Z921_9ROSI|nr:hypothetical protein Pint_05168 [Pistacia integerrima]
MVARTMVPIIYDDWRHVPKDLKRKIWDFVCEHFGVDPKSRKKTLKDIGVKWRSFKYILNKNFIIPFVDKSGKLVRPPPQYNFIRKSPWEEFATKRSSKNFQTLGTKLKEKQTKNKYNHRLSRKGYANLIEEIKQEIGLTKEEIYRSLTWKLARKRKGGGYDSESDLETRAKTGSLETDGKNDILSQALGTKEHPGLVRGMGKFITHEDNTCYLVVDSQANIVAKGTIIEYKGPNVWVTMDVVFEGSPSLPFPDDEEFLVKVSDAIGHRLLWPGELVLRVANMVKTTIIY